jgi:glycosyltransferase involved in cell wall biosynthesis
LEYPLHQNGGVEVLVRELLPGLAERFEILLVSGDVSASLDHSPLRTFWSDHYSWPTAGATRQDGKKLAAWLVERGAFLAHFHFGGTYQWRARSVVHCPVPIVARAGIPCVSTNHGAFSLFEFVGPQRPLWFKLAALPLFWPPKLWQLAHVRWEATVSRHDLRAVRRRFFPAYDRFIQIYHSKLDGNRPLNPDKQKRILCLGTVGRRKGQPFLVDAFGRIARNHPEWTLVIAGRHAEEDVSREIDRLVAQHGLQKQIQLEKDVSDARALELTETSAIFAFPSLQEGLGLALQEAMFAGAACIGSSTGGITDLIEHRKTGLLVRPSDPTALAIGLEELISQPGLRDTLAMQGRASIPEKKMTRELMIERHRELYQNVIAQHG